MEQILNLEQLSLHGKEIIMEQDENAITDKLSNETPIESLLVAPNVNDADAADHNPRVKSLDKQIVELVNAKHISPYLSLVGTTVIKPYQIGVYDHNGVVEIVGEGRWICMNPRARCVGVYSLNEAQIHYNTFTFVRINKGQYGLALDSGRPIVLSEGIHVRNNLLFQVLSIVDVNKEYINHRTIHIIRVPKGQYAKIIENNIPKILKSGLYVVNSNYFVYGGLIDMGAPYICHQTIHVLRVTKDQIRPLTVNNKPYLLKEGSYIFNTQLITVFDPAKVTDSLIKHSTITRFRINNGEIGLAWCDNKPVMIQEPGVYEIDSPNFIFVKTVLTTEKYIQLGSAKRIVVYDGEVGVSYNDGKLDVLQPNTYLFDTTSRIFTNFLSTQQMTQSLSDDKSTNSTIQCDTKDFVEVGIHASVFYRITDAARAITVVGNEDKIKELIRETSIATLQGIIRSSSLSDVAQSKTVHIQGEIQSASSNSAQCPAFFDKVHDDFMARLHESFIQRYGIEIANIRIENFKIINVELAKNIQSQALNTAKTQNELANLEGQQKVQTASQQRDADVMRIRASAEADKLTTETKAKNNAVLTDAQARADSLKIIAKAETEAQLIRADAEAKSRIMIAESEAKAIELKAAAELKRAQALQSTQIGQQLALLQEQMPTIGDALKSVQKVIYMPADGDMSGLLKLFTLPGMAQPGMILNDHKK
ncbi:Conserved_hypothetical protein [Hexamita inflata]|uniref:Band 7 domain-containing protein n=1 Tax=Hexamita inflata TaxID=28002 RepID=A0AA86P211_9EUKA|nr:Conserved hypothetical protein [Hexamita inflata]